jgi:hypothetical protein
LRDGAGPLAEDLKQFLGSLIAAIPEREDIIRMVGSILRSNDKARGILEGLTGAERRVLTEALLMRVDNCLMAASPANNVTSAIGAAIFLWQEEDIALGADLGAVWDGLIDAARLLSSKQFLTLAPKAQI